MRRTARACLLAMQRLGLDRVWWLVTPGNPLKDTRGLAPLASASTPRKRSRIIRASTSPTSRRELGTRYTYETIAYLVRRCPHVRFVWIMGADNLRSFHRWQRWRDIATLVPIAVIDRLGPSLYAAGRRRRPGPGAGPHSRSGGQDAAGTNAAGLDLSAWPQIAAVVDGAAGGTRLARR